MSLNLFTTHVFRMKESVKEIELFPFGDVHYDTPGCDHERFSQYIKRSKGYDQRKCLYLLMGDCLDFASTSEKRKLQSAGLHETTIDRFDRMAKSDIGKFMKEIEHMKGHVIGCIGGNHSWKFADGQLSDEYMAEALGTKYLGWLSYIKVMIPYGGSETRLATFDIVACHGKAGGKLLGTSINQVNSLREIFPNADLFIMGHDHKLSSTPAVILYADHDSNGDVVIKQKDQRLLRSGSFKKTYSVGVESYEVGKLYQPAILGGLHVTLKMNRIRTGGKDVILKSIESHV